MFEAHVLHLLRKYLGEYVHGLSSEALRISVWKGDVVLKDLKLKAEALNALKLPVTVKAGFVGTITLKVPWKSLGKEPVIVLIDRVFVLAHPAPDGRTMKEEDREKLFEAKMQQIEEAESATLDAISKSKMGSLPSGNSWLSSIIATIIGNLKISISNVHIRYEDTVSNPGHPFSSGVTLAKLAAVTMDEHGNEIFDTSGALDKLRKLLQLERLAVYHDSDSLPWEIDKRWEDISPQEWIEIFEDGISEPSGDHRSVSKWAMNRTYLVYPINANLQYHRLGNQERTNPEIPFEKVSLVLSDVSLTITETQYHDWIKLLEAVSRYKKYLEVSHLRPAIPVSKAPKLWWKYAAQAGLQQKKTCYRLSWDQIRHLCQRRRQYIQLYMASLQHSSNVNHTEIREIEKDLDSKVILLWRLLAHAKVESVKSKVAAQQRTVNKRSWFSFRWGADAEEVPLHNASEEPQFMEEKLTREEWQAINKLLSYQPDEEIAPSSSKDMQNMMKLLVTITIGHAAARIISVNQMEIVCGRFEQLHVSTKFKHRSIYCDVLLKFYGLSAPEGSLAQSVCSEQKVNALAASFVHLPIGENIDWRVSATISPCHVTVLMESIDRFLEFVKRSNAVSPTVALETATALQMKFEKVTRRAQEQFQMVLEEQSRFAFDVDLDAPKVRVPLRTNGSLKCGSHFLLDFGHFTLHTVESQPDEHRKNPYSRFLISGRDIAAFFTDCGSDFGSCSLVKLDYDNQLMTSSTEERVENPCSLIDRCGMAVIVDQIRVPHPSYPSTRISVQVPNLGIHFSPERYSKIMELLNIFYGTIETCSQPTADDFEAKLAPWSSADLATDGRILVWKGIGNSIATWKPCFLLLSGSYLYLFESAKSQSYQRCLSMGGRQVLEVPPENIGGSPFCIAVCFRGMDIQKALESSSTWILDFRDEEEKAIWFRGLVQATYEASAAPSVDVLGDSKVDEAACSSVNRTNAKSADLIVKGALMEMKLFIYGKAGDITDGKQLDEALILEILGAGGKVHLIHADGDLTVKMKLHSLKIKDELQCRLLKGDHYLAVSVLKNEALHPSSGSFNSRGKDVPVGNPDDDDSFTDALSEFMSQQDAGIYLHNLDSDQQGLFGIPPDFESLETLIPESDVEGGQGTACEEYYEVEGIENVDFVSVSFSTRSSTSPDYDGVDTQMSVRMSKLEFFCNRPTIVALISFGLDISAVNYETNGVDREATLQEKLLVDKEKADEKGRVRGLLGFSKERVIFYLNMNVGSVTTFLNKEDGSQLATLVQESFLLDLKVHPSSLCIEGTLGNFRLCDRSLGSDHCWAWLCDIRNPGTDSLIKFKFNSYSAEDDDYEGYDYSLQGQLSAVRIVVLYRFVQEIMVYFMELASPRTEEAIKLVDKVGGFERLIQKYEIDGSAALKLDLALDTPVIVVPRNSRSKDFIQLDLGKLHITNKFSWHGSPDDPSAVHLDLLHAQILGINMSIGVGGCLGKPMIREGQGLDILVCRSLKDVFRKVPSFSLEVKVELLHAILSEKEYKVILDCAYMNLSEEPRLPPSFRGGNSYSKETIKLLVDKVNLNGQLFLSQTVTVVAVVVNHALLELRYGADGESPLAHIALEGLWVSYRMTSLSETDLYVTIPKFSILDVRPNTKPEMRLMLGSSTDASKQPVAGKNPSFIKSSSKRIGNETGINFDMPISTMFLMDYRCRVSSQSFVIRVQQPRVLVVPDFLLAVAEFFVPALGALTGREETMDPKNDPISRNSSIVLMEPVYKQTEDVVHLSPSKQLVADWAGIDEYTYDGCGNCICLDVETDAKEFRSTSFRPIIFIGRGKRLRFVNVKIENGSLLRKYIYLSNDSSYSASIDDGVNIVFLDNSLSSDMSIDQGHQSSEILSSTNYHSDPKGVQSFTFETQVVSPEFTFYDGTKSSLDDSAYGEKLLRAKLDLSFIYASKEKDTWIRALVKDFTVEAGSGLIILDPVDISGGYTSVKDKTNISLSSTDICIHLSLSAISLILNLQSQASAALSFGNAPPVVSCINFDRIWVSEKGTNITFWRPQASANYVILGDCVTSRPVPPSQAVMAVSNTYGRVRKPVGFDLIGSFKSNQGLEGGEGSTIAGSDCSLWMPIPPSGYTALGCVAHLGNQPPPDHVVYCLRSDLVTSTAYSDCLFSSPSPIDFASGFSIWRIDNNVGSFFAHSSTECPQDRCYDINHLLLWNSNRAASSPIDTFSNFSSDNDNENQHTNQRVNTSGWDILRSISKATNSYTSSPNFERIWWDKGSDLRHPVSIWRPIARPGYAILGDCITEGLEPPALGIIFKNDNSDISTKPVQFTKVAHIAGKGIEEIFLWYPIAPPGYVSLGCVVSKTDEAPCADLFCCPRMDLVSQANIHEVPLSRSSSSREPQCWSIWKVENQACTFLARPDFKKPSSRLAYIIGDSVKPRTQENIMAELKLRFLSVTILDSICGIAVTPLFDTTITNIKLATHGRLESMNAVLVSSIAASTFNAQLEAWEPLVEPFDGIFKFETYHTNEQSASGLGKRVRIASTNTLNVNVSAANLESFVGSILSWKRQLELERKAIKDAHCLQKNGDDMTFSALDEDDLQTVIVENKLGCDIYIKKAEEDLDAVDKLHHGDCASVWIPPPRFSDRLNVSDELREARYYIAVTILEAKGLPLIDDGNSHNFFCALRLVVDSQATEQKLFPQSARTKCVKPVVSRINDWYEGTVSWNELFMFEVPRKATAKLEIEVTNLAAKAGKGDVVSALSFPVGRDANILRKAPSIRMIHQPYDAQNIKSYPLKRMVEQSNFEDMHDGTLLVSTSYFERNTIANLQKDVKSENDADGDLGFWVGLEPEGEWKSIRSLLPLSVVPKSLQNEFIAMEVVMKNGKKHAIFRSLVTVVNDSDVGLNISTCHSSGTDFVPAVSSNSSTVEEVFQNQYYNPTSGWGNKWPSNLKNPGHWSTRDFSYSSKDFFEPPLPPGWKWLSGWTVDKSKFVDNDGWAYGPDLISLKWPPTSKFSTKLASDVVRRRRWIRSRQKNSEKGIDSLQTEANIVDPGASAVLSWKSTSKDSDNSLQFKPRSDDSQSSYSWACAVAVGSSYICGKDQLLLDEVSKQSSRMSNCSLKLNQLEKKDVLMCCSPSTGSKLFWFSVGTDASVLNTELNAPVYDWKISINSPLKLENRLPCLAEFTVWEKIKESNCVERHHGVISSRQSVHIYSADIQKPLYLTLSVQGGWLMEKDPVLVLDPSFTNRVTSFWMVHQQSRRKLRVSIEYDMGGTSAAPKTLRLFVPYWIVNDSSVALAYRVVEVEPLDNTDMDSVLVSRAVKSAKTALKNPLSSLDRRQSSSRRNLQVLEAIEDSSPFPSMLSPQDYAVRSGLTMFQSQKDTYQSPRVGIAVAMHNSEVYSSGISLHELENKERIDVKAFNSDGFYYKLSALLNMTSDRTKVVHFQPQTLFTNRAGCSLCLQQCGSQTSVWIHPSDPPKPFGWQSSAKVELLKLRMDGYQWSLPFSVSNEGVMRINLKKDVGDNQKQLRVLVRSGAKRSRFEVVFCPNSLASPYRIENRSMFLPIRFRQVDGVSDSWQLLLPNAAASFMWEDVGRRHLLELLVDGTDPLKSVKYDIDEILDPQPVQATDGSNKALCVSIVKEEKINVVKISDWMPESEPTGDLNRIHPSLMSHIHSSDSQKQQISTDCEFHIFFELAELGISVIDHTPEEILYLSIQSLSLAYSTGLGSGINRFKLRMRGLQVDNQLPLTPMPVLFRPQRVVAETDYILKFSMTMQSNGSLDLCVYPFIGLYGLENSASFLINIHEPIIWRLHEMIQQVKLSRLYDSQTTAASVDPIIQIGVLNISEVRFKVTMAMSPSQRPRGVLGFWASLMTALGNTENMPVKINPRYHENVCMRQSSMISMAISNIRKDLLGQPLQLLSGVDILGNASSALGHMSKGVAALSMDKKFIQSRQKQETKGVEDLRDVIREGGGALAKGFFRGVTGILTKPLEGAKTSGVEGFVQGVGKGIIGAAAQPVSGVLDLLSKTTEGANAMRMKIASAITSDEQLLRKRLPRVISGDNLLQPYDEYKAQGQVILQLAESGSFFGQVDLFKVRGKFALSDAYEDHFLLPKGKILMVTHRRVILLQQPSNIIGQRKFSPARDSCSIMWDVLWDDLGTMELTHGKKDSSVAPPSRLILYLHSRTSDFKENICVIKCNPESQQALEVYLAIEHAMNTYMPNASKGIPKKIVTKPYSPIADGPGSDLMSKEGGGPTSPPQMPGSVPLASTFGSSTKLYE